MSAEQLSAIAQLIDAIAWPAVLVIVLLTQRQRIGALLEDLESFTLPAGAGAKFRRRLERETRSAIPDPEAVKHPPTEREIQAAERLGEASLEVDLAVIRQQAAALAREYERIRAAMRPGPERTRRMEVVFTKMRTLGVAMKPLLDDLMPSRSPGERLAAIAVLQLEANADALSWLGQRLAAENPFVGYHAAVALLVAVRRLDRAHEDQLREALSNAAEAIGRLPDDADRTMTIRTAQQEFEKRLES